jgi:hypothetical protein
MGLGRTLDKLEVRLYVGFVQISCWCQRIRIRKSDSPGPGVAPVKVLFLTCN